MQCQDTEGKCEHMCVYVFTCFSHLYIVRSERKEKTKVQIYFVSTKAACKNLVQEMCDDED